jgi:hypothetical protein
MATCHPIDAAASTLFVHIPKTGGTSFVNAFRSTLEPGSVVIYQDNEALAGFHAARGPEELPVAKLIAGHLPLPEFRAKGYSGWAIAVVRSPVDRMLSMYRYLQSSTHPDHESLKFETSAHFLDYLRNSNWYVNVQCRMLSGQPSFAEACESLLRERLLVVPLEQIDRLAATLTAAWDEPLVLPRHNVTDTAQTIEDQPLFEEATDLYQEDLLLYQRIVEVAEDMLVRAQNAVEDGEIHFERKPMAPAVVVEEESQKEEAQTQKEDAEGQDGTALPQNPTLA